ncbi:MAG TPA: peptidylprolyl isomerase [Kiritimatiellia bacterium]|nr:peptidylprolyl isomerase [Kiritimatiellia bacterium]
MMITKFRRMIRNKIIWLLILVVIIFAFVIWGTQMPETGAQGPRHAGVLNGDNISFEEFQRARFNSYLAAVLMTGRHIPITPEVEDQLFEMAWQRIATLREAERLGIGATNKEVVDAIQSLEFFQTNGRFNPQAYEQFAQQFLAPMRASKRDFEEHIRQEIMHQKLRMLVDRNILVTPMEIQRTFSTLTDTFEIEYARIDASKVAADVTVSEEDILGFYEKDPEQFMLPERVQVKSAIFAITDFTNDAEISDAEIEEYYDFNMEKFALPDETPSDDLFSITATQYRPLDEVREEIRAELTARQAAILAEAKANDFVQELSLRRTSGKKAFDQVAAEWGIELMMVPPFSMRERPMELENGLAVARAAFSLTDDEDYYYSDPVKGTNFIYVLALVDRAAPRIPLYEEVKGEVEMRALEIAVYNALTEKANEIQQSAIAGLSAGLSFADVLSEYQLNSLKPEPFTLNSPEIDPDLDSSIIRAILTHNSGEVTQPVESEDGYAIIFIKNRTPDNLATIESFRPQIVSTLRRQSSQVAFNDFQQYLLKRGNFEDNFRRRTKQSDEDTDQDS